MRSRGLKQFCLTAVALGMALAAAGIFAARPAAAFPIEGIGDGNFQSAAQQGFGDRQNSWAWSMAWWNGHLYVGTNRAHFCADVAAIHLVFPNWIDYPPTDPDIECTPLPEDLPLQAEIWRWSRGDGWERVFQSPEDAPIPARPGRFVAHDVGFRGMLAFQDPGGQEALYVTSVAPSFIWRDTPTARILRSTDGVNFEPVPADPGTALGDYPFASMRNPIIHDGRFYVQGGAVQGSGVLLEAENPAGGNDNFRVVSVPGQVVSSAASFNGYLYMGLRDSLLGYSVVKTETGGPLPYQWTTVIPEGAFLPSQTNVETLSMQVFDGKLYVGTNGLRLAALGLMGPGEVIRINPDDTWDLVAGNPRLTDHGWKYPVTGFDGGFGNFFNAHMWQMEVYQDNLFLGTFDSSTTFKEIPNNDALLADQMGFDFFRTPNGIDFYPITTTGFGDRFNFGVRSLQATPFGLFLGTANYYYGLQVWRGYDTTRRLFMPMVLTGSNGRSPSAGGAAPPGDSLLATPLSPPEMVQTEVLTDSVVVTWEPVQDAQSYVISRGGIVPISLTLSVDPSIVINVSKWTTATQVGVTTGASFQDDTADSDARYIYYVQAVDGTGAASERSLMSPAPSLALPATFTHLDSMVADAQSRGYLTPEGVDRFDQAIAAAQAHFQAAQYQEAAADLQSLRDDLDQENQALIKWWKAVETSHFLGRLRLRVLLVDAGILDPSAVN